MPGRNPAYAIGDGEGLRQVALESDLAALAFMQLDHHVKKRSRTAKALEDLP